jgi:hypothetical protein
MTRISIPNRVRQAFVWGAAFALLLGIRFESDYRYSLSHLPALVDEHGNKASVEVAMAGLDTYERAQQTRRFGFVSLTIGVLLCVCAVGTKNQRGVPNVVA